MPIEIPSFADFAALSDRVAILESTPPSGGGGGGSSFDPSVLEAAIADLRTRVDAVELGLAGVVDQVNELGIGRRLLGIYGNLNSSELVSSIPITKGTPYNVNVVQSVFVPAEIKTGDILFATMECQVTTEHTYNVMVASGIHVVAAIDHVGNSSGFEIGERNGENINRDIHHKPVKKVGWWVADARYPNGRYFNQVLYSASTAASSGDRLTVNRDYGKCVVAHFR